MKLIRKLLGYIKDNPVAAAVVVGVGVARLLGAEGAEHATPLAAGLFGKDLHIFGIGKSKPQPQFVANVGVGGLSGPPPAPAGQQISWGTPDTEAAGGARNGAAYYSPVAAAGGGGGGYYGGAYYDNSATLAEAQRQAAIAAARGEINAGYDDYDRGLLGLLPQADTLAAQETERLKGRFDTEKTTTKSKLDRTLATLAGDRTEVEGNRKMTLKDVARNYARQLASGNLMLSSRGAGDSSATGQMALGLTTAQAGARSNVQGQANSQIAGIGEMEVGANKDFEEQNRLLQDWFETETGTIGRKTGDFKTRVDRERAGANLERNNALANVDKNSIAGLGGRLGNFSTNFAQLSREIADALAASKPNLNPNALTQNFDVQALARPNISGLAFNAGAAATPDSGLPVPVIPRRRADENKVAPGLAALAFV